MNEKIRRIIIFNMAKKTKKKRKSKLKKLTSLVIVFAIIAITTLVGFYLYRLSMELQYPLPHYDIVNKYSIKYNVDAPLIYAIIKAESNFIPDVRSAKGAIGLMQVTPETGQWIAEKMNRNDYDEQKLINPDTNIEFGCWYINWMRTLDGLNYGENMDVIIAAYNCGHNKVTQWLDNIEYSKDGKKLDSIPYEETQSYVEKVNKYYDIYKEKLKKN